MSTREEPVVVDDPVDEDAVAVSDVATEPAEDLDTVEQSVDGAVGDEGGADEAVDAAPPRRGRGRIVVGGLAAAAVAVAAVWAAGAVGGSEDGLPLTVGDPAVVVAALDEGGFACTGSVTTGQVATCSSTVAVRTFDSADDATAWIEDLLRDPLTSSAFGWVQHGNAVVSAPLDAAPAVAAALGPEATIY